MRGKSRGLPVADLGLVGRSRAGQPGSNQSADGRRATPAGQPELMDHLSADLRSGTAIISLAPLRRYYHCCC